VIAGNTEFTGANGATALVALLVAALNPEALDAVIVQVIV